MDQTHADIKAICDELSRLYTDLFVTYKGGAEQYHAYAEHKKDAWILNDLFKMLQVSGVICTFYDAVYPILSLPEIRKQKFEDFWEMMSSHESYLGHVITFDSDQLDEIHDPELRGYFDQMLTVINKLIHAINAIDSKA